MRQNTSKLKKNKKKHIHQFHITEQQLKSEALQQQQQKLNDLDRLLLGFGE